MKERFLLYFFTCMMLYTSGSCQKRRPPKGIYLCTYRYDSGGMMKTSDYKVVESNRKYIVLHSSFMGQYKYEDTLFKMKEKNQIEGNLRGFGSFYPFEVKGAVKRDGAFNFKIEGNFTHLEGSQGSGLSNHTGTFVLKED
jgi:hypothetical protein